MKNKTSLEVYDYWNRLRGSARAPLRSQIEPGAIRHTLPDLFMLEADASGEPVFRLAGTRICGLFGREFRAHPFAALWAQDKENAPVNIAAGVIRHEMPALLNVTGFTESGQTMRFEMLLLPVRSTLEACDRLLGVFSPDGPISRLGIEPLLCLAMDRSRLIGLDDAGSERVATGDAGRDAGRDAGLPKSLLPLRADARSSAVQRLLQRKLFPNSRPN
jgi:hypothetical protein